MNRNMILIEDIIDEISMGPFGSDIKVDNFVSKGVPVLNGSNINGVRLSESFSNFVSKEKAKSLKKANAKRGDIVVTHRGTLGQIAYIPENSSIEQYVISQSQFRVSLNRKLVDPAYFTYYFHTKEGQKRLLSFKSHVGVPALAQATSNFKKLEFPLIPLSEQLKVAKILSDLDSKIDLNTKINAELESMATLIYNYWFAQFDFPDVNGKPYKSSGGKMVYDEILKSEIPEGWGCQDLKRLTSLIQRGISPKYVDNGGIQVLNQKCIRDQKVLFNDARRHGVRLRETDKRLLNITDVLVNSTGVGTLGRVAFIKRLPEKEITVDSHVTIVRANKELILPEYLAWTMMRLQPLIESAANGSTGQVELSKPFLEELKVVVPEIKIQRKFQSLLNPIIKKLANHEKESERLIKLRDWLLPMLMNGQVTVK
ncbi:TPA: restriction endonuclease subunit S [Legionella pneumophila]|uniref:restriction endonuclease subunit S n=1 Tax=Legionella pneumophila TaxID=446 RepID=UPI00077074C6|nr:restriction endonuclease subunit S [Legionella pneumophila]CZG19979.1 EcoKI restriction-modification system protein HsdS [Legionella pneumophila]HCE5698302.1 restriction endonuclease subunit S [Legionella pneumophila]HCG0030925.1 restriction endonuclease subunit S [Legionella pneumophila]